MKLAKFLSLAIVALGLGIFQDLHAQTLARYDLQFVEVSNSGTFLDVKVQIRSSGVDFNLFDANLVFAYSPVSNLGEPILLKRFGNFDNTTSPRYAEMTVTNPLPGRISINIVHNQAPYTTVSNSWMDIVMVRVPITNTTGAYALTWVTPSMTAGKIPLNTLVYQAVGDKSTLVSIGSLSGIKGSLNPFNLLAFTARLNGKSVLLNWMLGADAKLASFDIERSAQNSAWKSIGTVKAGAMTNAANQSYAFTDMDITGAKTLFYRLKLNDQNGDSKYSSTVKVSLTNAVGVASLLASYPNPFNPAVTVHFTIANDEYVTVTIYDDAGKEITRLYDNELLPAGEYSKVFNGSNLASGKYLLRMTAGDYTATENLILNK